MNLGRGVQSSGKGIRGEIILDSIMESHSSIPSPSVGMVRHQKSWALNLSCEDTQSLIPVLSSSMGISKQDVACFECQVFTTLV